MWSGAGQSFTITASNWAAIGRFANGTGNWPCPNKKFRIVGVDPVGRYSCDAYSKMFDLPGKYHIFSRDDGIVIVDPYSQSHSLCYLKPDD
jgi:hypothetical protein